VPIVTSIDLLKNRKTKIVATVGPASSSSELIEKLINVGVNVFRLNMSHGHQKDHKTTHNTIRRVAEHLGQPIAILADLCGPKIRTGQFPNGGIDLLAGREILITTDTASVVDGVIFSQYGALAEDVKAGDRILLAGGLFELRVISSSGHDVRCEVIHGGRPWRQQGHESSGGCSIGTLHDRQRH
jgi:pyruvate kinase